MFLEKRVSQIHCESVNLEDEGQEKDNHPRPMCVHEYVSGSVGVWVCGWTSGCVGESAWVDGYIGVI